MIQVLVDRGANVNRAAFNGETPLYLAAQVSRVRRNCGPQYS